MNAILWKSTAVIAVKVYNYLLELSCRMVYKNNVFESIGLYGCQTRQKFAEQLHLDIQLSYTIFDSATLRC
jgi:hypothetical protein